jgi:hypothetical protein
MTQKGTSLCKGKSVKEPNRCRKVRGCKVAKGSKRTFCRKKHNKTQKKSSSRSPRAKTMRKRN